MLSAMKIVALTKRLEEEKDLLESELRGLGRQNPTNPSDWEPLPPETNSESDPIDVADASTTFDTNASIVADLETRYNNVVEALNRIKNDSYGTCSVCHKAIIPARLDADPAADTCVEHVSGS